MKYKFIIWDWNGTLLNDLGSSLASVNDMLTARNMPHIDVKRYKECIGVPIRCFYEKVFDIDNEDYDELLRQYNEGYLYHLKDYGLSDNAEEMLDYFRKCGCKQIIVSSSNNDQLITNVKKYGVYDYFDALLGAEGFHAESKIERAVNYLKNNGAGKAIVIGDLEHDYEMAKEIGADCCLLSTGHEKEEKLRRCGATVIDSLTELYEITA